MKFLILPVFYSVFLCVNIYGQDGLLTNNNVQTAKQVRHDTSASLAVVLPIAEESVRQQVSAFGVENTANKKSRAGKSEAKKADVEQTYFGRSASPELLV